MAPSRVARPVTLAILSVQFSDEGLFHVAGLTALRHLHLSFCEHVSDRGLGLLAPLAALEGLNLELCRRVTDKGVAHFRPHAASIQSLSLACCDRVSDAGLVHVGALIGCGTLTFPTAAASRTTGCCSCTASRASDTPRCAISFFLFAPSPSDMGGLYVWGLPKRTCGLAPLDVRPCRLILGWPCGVGRAERVAERLIAVFPSCVCRPVCDCCSKHKGCTHCITW